MYLGQAAGGVGNSIGGDIMLEGGTGNTAGSVKIGLSSEAVVIGNQAKTTTVLGNLMANTGSVTGLLTAGRFSTTGSVTSASISTGAVTAASTTLSGALTVTGNARVVGSILAGDAANAFTIGRVAYGSVNNGRSTYVLGQAAGSALSLGKSFLPVIYWYPFLIIFL